jgi:hypothetical protein
MPFSRRNAAMVSGLDPLAGQVRIGEGILEKPGDLVITTVLSHGQQGISKRVRLVARIERLVFNQYADERQVSFAHGEFSGGV